MWLVDLAGSEQFAKTEVGETSKEAKFIKQSVLSVLIDAIASLASKNAHIPYCSVLFSIYMLHHLPCSVT